jgi:hypothetical protein
MALFGSMGGSASESSSQSQSSGKTFVDQAQQPFLDFLRNTAQGAYRGLDQGAMQGTADQLYGQGQGFLQQLQGVGQGFGSQASMDLQTENLSNELGTFFNEQLMPGIRRDAVGAGGLGGSRDQVARAQGAGQVADAFSSGVAQIYGQGEQQRLAGEGMGAQAALGGIGALSGLQGIANMPFQQQLAPLMQLASIFGNPTVLSEQQASSSSDSSSASFNVGF